MAKKNSNSIGSDRKEVLRNPQGTDRQMLGELCRVTFNYFLREVDEHTGLIADKSQPRSPASIAAIGLALSAYVVAVERAFLSRSQAAQKVLKVLRFFHGSPQGVQTDATGYKGFFYHFLHIRSGKRASNCELSTIDTAIFIAGALTSAAYFDRNDLEEVEIRELAESLYRRVDWQWALNGEKTISHGWKPESGFLPCRWDTGYCEAHILYVLALGSPTFAIDPEGYHEWISTFEWKSFYGIELFYAGPLFIHQLSQMWLDCRGIRDLANRRAGVDYFENSRRATHVQRAYAIQNPLGFTGYSEFAWGLTASDGPGPAAREVNGEMREFYGYEARGAPLGPDDGTLSPWAVAASLPFAPEIVLDTLRHAIERLDLTQHSAYGFDASFNPSLQGSPSTQNGWISPWIFGLNQGPIILMIANYESELIWRTVRKCAHIVQGLRRAGFRGAWLDIEASNECG